MGGLKTNCYLLGDEATHEAAVIDPGAEADAILSALQAEGLKATKILLTHGHFDHVGAAGALCAAWGAPGPAVYLHRADFEMPGSDLFPLRAQMDRGEGPGGIGFYSDGDHLSVGGLDVEVLHTPGHTRGGVTLAVGDALFTGDTLFKNSAGRADLPGGDYEALMASLKRLAELEGERQVYPGHGGATTLDWERRAESTNYFVREAMAG